MKDYSLNEKERKDFILGYDVTSDGLIIVKLAEGEPLTLPYNTHNEQILLTRMEEQLKKASKSEAKYNEKRNKYVQLFRTMLCSVGISAVIIFASNVVFVDTIFALILSLSAVYGVSFVSKIFCLDRLLEDLQKNKKFLEMRDKINSNIKSNENILVNVSSNTKKIVRDNLDDDRPLFDINSFNYVTYEDLEHIVENIDRNERFGFDYKQQERPTKGLVRKKTRN